MCSPNKNLVLILPPPCCRHNALSLVPHLLQGAVAIPATPPVAVGGDRQHASLSPVLQPADAADVLPALRGPADGRLPRSAQ